MTRAERYQKNAEQEKANYRTWYSNNAERRRLTEQRRYHVAKYERVEAQLKHAAAEYADTRLTLDAIDRQLETR